MSDLLKDDQAAHLWERRHRSLDALRSGGDIGRSTEENLLFYQVRLGQLIEYLGVVHSGSQSLDLLDAGCGTGFFAGALAEAGFNVVGVDRSSAAVSLAIETFPGVEFQVGDLDVFGWGHLFDVVFSIDVMIHVLDDEKWRDIMHNLVSHVRMGGTLLIVDTMGAEPDTAGDYIRYRPARWYEEMLGRYGFRRTGSHPYRVSGSRLGFHLYSI